MTEGMSAQINRAVLVGLSARCLGAEENATEATMDELEDLLETAGGTCAGMVLQSREAPDPRTFIGEGKVEEVRELVEGTGADLVIFDNSLSPSQQRVRSPFPQAFPFSLPAICFNGRPSSFPESLPHPMHLYKIGEKRVYLHTSLW